MGYTHYWEITDHEAFMRAMPAIANDAKHILEALRHTCPVAFDSDSRYEPPQLTPERIRLNGIGADGHETFVLPPQGVTALPGFGFCKTNKKPYDLIVTTILLRAKHHAGDLIELSSDGGDEAFNLAHIVEQELFKGGNS